MKKNFIAPAMNITRFQAENVVTASGGDTAQANVQSKLSTWASENGIKVNAALVF